MRLQIELLGALVLLTSSATAVTTANSRCFPDGFIFGSATAAYQVEGAWNEGGRTPSIWDDFCRAQPDVACANVVDDFYHRYKSDIQLMVETGLQSFRFSISWSRVMNWNQETQKMVVNQPGVAFYHGLIDELNKNGITPILTLYHWDLPSELQNELNPPGWLNKNIIDYFYEYSELIYHEFGNKVDYWTTFNEPLSFIGDGYAMGNSPPQMNQDPVNAYRVGHHMLIAHGKSVDRFRQLKGEGIVRANARIGIVLNIENAYPLNASDPMDVEAAERNMQYEAGWFLNPIVNGEYPQVMRERAGDLLPTWTDQDRTFVKGSYDLFMLNHYHSRVVTDCASKYSTIKCDDLAAGWARDRGVDQSRIPEGARRASNGTDRCAMFSGYAPGYLDTIKWMHAFDPKAEILLTENGWCGNEEIDNQDQLWYYQTHLEQVYKAITEENIPIIGYTAWSFLDNYEWGTFTSRFGLYYVNWTSQTGSKEEYTPKSIELERIPRTAAKWYAQVAKSNCLDADIAVVAVAATTATSWSSHWVMIGVVALGDDWCRRRGSWRRDCCGGASYISRAWVGD